MSIRKKISLSFGSMIIIMVICCLLILIQLKGIDSKYRNTLEEGLPEIETTNNIEKEIILIGSQIQTYLLGNRDIVTELEVSKENVYTYIENLKEMLPSKADQEQIAALEAKVTIFHEKVDRALSMVSSGATRGASTFYVTNVIPTRNDVVETSSLLSQKIQDAFDQAQSEATSKTTFAIILAIIIVIVAVIIGAGLSRFMYQIIAKPIYKLRNSVSDIAIGNLTAEDIEVNTKDEIGELAQSFNEMKLQLKTILSTLAENAEHLNTTAEELSASTQEVTASSFEIANQSDISVANAKRSAISAKESSFAMEETATAISKIAEATQVLHNSALNTESIADQGEVNIQSASAQMSSIYDSTKLTTQLIQKLSKQSEEIQGITNIITGITEQTNLLALNAAIEAARAGEHGKGFAVVADEVRKLAEQSKNSANQIVQLTSEIQLETRNVEKAVQSSLATVEDGVNVIQKAGKSFNEIVQAVDDMKVQIENISAVSEQISASTEKVAASVSDITSSSVLTAEQLETTASDIQLQVSTLQEISSVSTDLTDRATSLQEIVNKFKV